jgi:phosphoglycerate kinase
MKGSKLDFLTLDSFDMTEKTVFLRLDVNSPINPITGEITGSTRFLAHLETLRDLSQSKVVILAHQSRPGKEDFTSLRSHAMYLQRLLGRKVKFIDALFGESVTKAVSELRKGEILMLENTRFYSEEIDIDGDDIEAMEKSHIVRGLLPLMNYFVNDAFPAIHRPQTTLVGFHRLIPNIAGRLIEKEIVALDRFMKDDSRPKLAILAGSKINESISVAKNFLDKGISDRVITGGVVGNAFLWAGGIDIGKKNRDFIVRSNKNWEELINTCKELLRKYDGNILVPQDCVLNPSKRRVSVSPKMPDDELMADIGVDTIVNYIDEIRRAKSIFLNGPMGMYEMPEYSAGTKEIMTAISMNPGMKIAGGGHTLNALEKLDLMDKFDHASTGGGALISYLSGDPMPVLEALKESKKIFSGN